MKLRSDAVNMRIPDTEKRTTHHGQFRDQVNDEGGDVYSKQPWVIMREVRGKQKP